MEFHQLRYFVAAAETSSISRAAEREHVSQPAISRQIALLETQLGVALFDRVRKRIQLTDAGRAFLPKAKQILCDAATSVQQIREQFGGARKTLRIGFIGPFLDDLVAPSVRELRKLHPRTDCALFDLPPRAQIERLQTHGLDAAILGNLGDDHRSEFAVRTLSRHRMAVVLPDAHVAVGRAPIDLARLRHEDWISLSETFYPGRRQFLRAACAAAGFEPRIVAEVDSVALMLGSVAAGGGVALAPRHAKKLPHAGCAFVDLVAPAPVTELLLLTAKGPQARELQDLARILVARAKGLHEA